MSFEDSVVLYLNVKPSALDTVYWSHSLHDLRTITRLHMEKELIRAHSFTESLVLVASQVFGGGSSEAGKNVQEIGTAHEAMLGVAELLRGT